MTVVVIKDVANKHIKVFSIRIYYWSSNRIIVKRFENEFSELVFGIMDVINITHTSVEGISENQIV